MKKLFLLLSCIFILGSANLKAQIIFEKSYATFSAQYSSVFITDIGYDNFKYVLHDCYTDKFSLFNLDHSPFLLNVQIPINSDSCTRFSIGYITTSLFDCDSSTIEYALLPEQPIYPFRVYRTDGTQLFSKDSVYAYWCYGCQESSTEIRPIVNTPAGAKLYLQYPWGPGDDSLLIYGLCGKLPESINEIQQSNSFVNVYPNPSAHQINFEIVTPTSYGEYRLTIFNSAFQTVKTSSIKGVKTQIDVDETNLSSGTYFYSLQNKDKIFQTGKFIVSK